jgi:hypothetical protein
MSVTLTVSYLFTGLAGCLVSPRISRGARKLTRTLQVLKKNTVYRNDRQIQDRSKVLKPYHLSNLISVCTLNLIVLIEILY